jgi:hypothetical protein
MRSLVVVEVEPSRELCGAVLGHAIGQRLGSVAQPCLDEALGYRGPGGPRSDLLRRRGQPAAEGRWSSACRAWCEGAEA